ncbi:MULTISPECIES: tetratricopeptide repeat protein [Cohnella]|jgi:tetratricopeptide (TPR) repeat protein|uniref:tetratricopeptide repeat protein n=1 Tax=Cohnella TaxID=329857 RepID=UPI0003639D75|nr:MULTISPECIES: tetratricopeptide repeat protein [Cohnella]REK61197.1 MAG: tetratricopeptide repeat protein [Cohnella sp.]
MKTFFLFGLLWALLGNPFAALIVLLIVLYVLERRFVGLTPSLLRPFRRQSEIAKLRRQLALNPHDVSAKSELARLLIEAKKYGEAREVLAGIEAQMDHSAEYWSDLGLAELGLGQKERGERAMLRALEISPRVKYGLPYLRLGEAFADSDAEKALNYLQRFREIHSSSCEGYYRLGSVYARLGRAEQARQADRECREIYRSLPSYMKRRERKWALRSWLRSR